MRRRGARRLPASVALIGAASALVGCLTPAEITGGRAPPVTQVMRDGPPVPRVLVNQLGYLPARPKLATVRGDAAQPLDWSLLDRGGAVVARGKTAPFGLDRASGDAVHVVDFSAARAPGDGYVLEVAGARSHPFAIRADLYRKLKLDALAYFYQSRSGVPIGMPYARDPRWVRPAGHVGDGAAPCLPSAAPRRNATSTTSRRGR